MTPEMTLELVMWIIGGLLTTLIAVISWGVHSAQSKIASIADQLDRINVTLGSIERDLRGELAGLDRRVSILHTAMRSLHPEYKGLGEQ